MSNSEGVRNPVKPAEGLEALNQAKEKLEKDEIIEKELLKLAVKYSLQLLHRKIPGKSVELRVPPISAVSIVEGKDHKRGTPPAVIEVEPIIWLKIFLGELNWHDAVNQGLILASGANTDLSHHLPMHHDLNDEI